MDAVSSFYCAWMNHFDQCEDCHTGTMCKDGAILRRVYDQAERALLSEDTGNG